MNKQQNRSEVEQGPIVLADGSRGLYATQTAARNLLAMSRNGLWDIAGIDRGDLELVASTNVSEATDEQAEQVGYVWDDIARNLEAHSAAYGRGWSIHEDGDIFLVPDGWDWE